MSSPSLPTLNILTFGDSLTEGFSVWGTIWTPYSRRMKRCLEDVLGREYKFEVVTDGRSGDRVFNGGFEWRMATKCKS
jgi:hypothetical protein